VHVASTVIRGLRHHGLSAFWILALPQLLRMQTPTGHEARAGESHRRELARGDLQSSFPYRFDPHCCCLGHHRVVRGRGALRVAAAQGAAGRGGAEERCASARTIAAVLVPIQVVVGDLHGLNTLEHQPAKIAAMERVWKTSAARRSR
jgi:cytochrome d ubiquinol oxidase subunit I